MRRIWMGVLAAVALMAWMVTPAVAQADNEKGSCCSYGYFKTGKVSERREFCEKQEVVKEVPVKVIEVPAAERLAGDYTGVKNVGKRLEYVVLREVAEKPVVAAKTGHECFYSYPKVRKVTERTMMCEVNGQEVTCGGMADGQCKEK